MRGRIMVVCLALLPVLTIVGCYHGSESYTGRGEYSSRSTVVPRGTYQVNYSALLMDFYRSDPRMHQDSVEPGSTKFHTPARITVAQLGENQGATALLDALRAHNDVFTKVDTIPAVPPNLDSFYQYAENSVSLGGTEKTTAPQQSEAGSVTPREWLQQLRLMASDLGSDYLFAYSGSIDFRTKEDTAVKWLDLTIVGQFIVPSEAHTAQGRAIGLLIDTRTNRIVMSVSADTTRKKLTTTQHSENALRDLIGQMRGELQDKLAIQPTTEFTRRALQSSAN